MQSNIFAQAVPLLEEKKFNIDCTAVIQFLGRYKHGELIYPGAMHRSLKLDIKTVYDVLEVCAYEGLVRQMLEVYCPRCQRFTGNRYKSILDIPEYITCIHCDEEVDRPIEHAIVIYQVL